MMDTLIYIVITLACLVGLLLSALSLSGTWCVLLAAVLAWWRLPEAIGPATLIVFALVCIAVELLEALAAFAGVQKRGGSRPGGVAAILGGLFGAVIGSVLFPILGTIAGMLLGSFAGAFLVEYRRLKRGSHASHIAFGAVWARLGVMMLKTVLTLGMSLWLLINLFFGS
jgi:uncharacterized protein YqgC (DUF456 family)